MNTPAHVLLAAAVSARPGAPAVILAAVAGALLPDMMMAVMIGWESMVMGHGAQVIFDEKYFSPFWQKTFAITNSIPLYVAAALAGRALARPALTAFGVGAALHTITDLGLHHDDGRPHFWPFSDWILESPVSYWDPAHHGGLVSLAEIALCIGLTVVLLRRFRGVAVRAGIALLLAAELATASSWVWMMVFGG